MKCMLSVGRFFATTAHTMAVVAVSGFFVFWMNYCCQCMMMIVFWCLTDFSWPSLSMRTAFVIASHCRLMMAYPSMFLNVYWESDFQLFLTFCLQSEQQYCTSHFTIEWHKNANLIILEAQFLQKYCTNNHFTKTCNKYICTDKKLYLKQMVLILEMHAFKKNVSLLSSLA